MGETEDRVVRHACADDYEADPIAAEEGESESEEAETQT